MKAIVLNDFGGVENLEYKNIAIPVPADNEVLVEVKAISVNPVDAKTRTGKGQADKLRHDDVMILGWDISGIVTVAGTGVTQFKKGDEVFGMVNFPGHGRAYAEYVVAPANQLAIKPANITHKAAAAATLAPLTAYQAIRATAQLKPGSRVLVHSAAGGVGHYAVQLAKLQGAYVIGTSSAANKDFVLALGADEHVDYKARPFEEVVHDIDFVFDTIGGDNIDRSLTVLKKGGSIVSLASALNLDIEEKASAYGVNGHRFIVSSNGNDMATLAGMLERGELRSHVSQVFKLKDMAAAHLQIEGGKTVGKIVVIP